MKTMTCRQLAGACDKEFHANEFSEIAAMSRNHAMEMVVKGDGPHIEKMEEMMELMKKPEDVNAWFAKIERDFYSLPDDK